MELMGKGIHQRPPYVEPTKQNQNYLSTEFKLKVHIHNFDGHIGIEEYLDWLTSVETFFKYMNVAQDNNKKKSQIGGLQVQKRCLSLVGANEL